MTDTSVASDFLQSLDIQSDFTTKITFNCHCFINYSTDFLNIIICQVSDTNVRIYTCLSKNFVSACSADTIDIGKADFDTFVSW